MCDERPPISSAKHLSLLLLSLGGLPATDEIPEILKWTGHAIIPFAHFDGHPLCQRLVRSTDLSWARRPPPHDHQPGCMNNSIGARIISSDPPPLSHWNLLSLTLSLFVLSTRTNNFLHLLCRIQIDTFPSGSSV
ncbi:hypothetical protein BU24DRAFT_160085 [Aaosphaeria arxii CBS 175.79]|uniref:Uncharacterized protein n=1 Tax=Aaosphaeria arxii CBS 175.79 TaxID=1450172 RepID=A0A6A5XZU2_9PLEO|nr:uncharacterized protein BU24DRAFT_160085 [Aaosphaeria arxii CBS 175.79]KAF2017814.1 hypothetical protein BU24DRAFT_160085 [Aaosphaeria arxii CBS 175.79]